MSKRPNLILIMTDEMRGDCLGIAGHPDVKTPHLDTLAAQGIFYPNAYTACPSCVPARAALHTGLSQKSMAESAIRTESTGTILSPWRENCQRPVIIPSVWEKCMYIPCGA